MKTEIKVVLIASLATVFIGLINIFFVVRISAKQTEIELKKTRIELLETKIQNIEKVKSIISERVIDVSDIDSINSIQLYSRAINQFQKNSNDILSIGHLLNQGFINQLREINRNIDNYIQFAKQGIHIDNSEAKKVLEKMNEMNVIMGKELDKSLLETEEKINNLLK